MVHMILIRHLLISVPTIWPLSPLFFKGFFNKIRYHIYIYEWDNFKNLLLAIISRKENIARIEKSPSQVKGAKFWPKLSTYSLWAGRCFIVPQLLLWHRTSDYVVLSAGLSQRYPLVWHRRGTENLFYLKPLWDLQHLIVPE